MNRNKKGQFIKGYKQVWSLKSRKKLSNSLKRIRHKPLIQPTAEQRRSLKWRKKLSEALKGNKNCLGKKNRLGYKNTEEHKQKISKALRGKYVGEKSSLWKGGKQRDKHNGEAKNVYWRKAVFERDNFTCQKCKIKGGKLVAHHILNFSKYLKLRYKINNGITLCFFCHKEFHKIYKNINNTRKQIKEFLAH